jgi:hypothetical protein
MTFLVWFFLESGPMNMKDALAQQDMIKSASPATGSSLGPRASLPAASVLREHDIRRRVSFEVLAALEAGGTPALPVKSLCGQRQARHK